MNPRRSQNTAVICRRWPARSCSPSGLETRAEVLGRYEPGQLGPLPLDRPHQSGVLDRDGDLLRECRHQRDLGLGIGAELAATETDDADDIGVLEDGNPKEGSDPVLRCRWPVVLGIGQHIVDVDGPPERGMHPPGHGVATCPMRMLAFEGDLGRVAGGRCHQTVVALVVGEVDVTGLRPAQPPRCLCDRVEDGLEVEGGAADEPEHLRDGCQTGLEVTLDLADATVGAGAAAGRPGLSRHVRSSLMG